MERVSIAVLIPCKNEEVSVGAVIDGFRIALPDAAVYVYDNNSQDRIAAVAAESDFRQAFDGEIICCRGIVPRLQDARYTSNQVSYYQHSAVLRAWIGGDTQKAFDGSAKTGLFVQFTQGGLLRSFTHFHKSSR